MRITSYTIILILIAHSAFSQRVMTREDYILKYRELAVREMIRTGVPASIKLAQACHESNNGNSELSRKGNNHFGIKCQKTWKGKAVYHDDDYKNECFRAYNTDEESFIDHSNFLMVSPRYSNLFKLKITDYKGWARGLKAANYATDPNYAQHLIRIIEKYDLHVYDKVTDLQSLERLTQSPVSSGGHSLIYGPPSGGRVTSFNKLSSIIIKPGDSMANLANELGMKLWQLYQYNDYPFDRVPRVNEILYLEPKFRKGTKGVDTHIVARGETMHYISQRYGIKLKPLLRRNGLKPGQEPSPGTSVRLR